MSHEITNNDRQQGLSQAWHGLTEVLPVIVLVSCWLAQWDVKLRAMFRPTGTDADGKQVFTPSEHHELVCTDNESIVVSRETVNPKTYHVLTNQSFLGIVADAMAQIPGAIVASVGSLCNRAKIFVTLAVPNLNSFMAAGREFKPYLNFLSSHDKSTEFTVVASMICTVCHNTFSLNLHNSDDDALRISIKHRPGMAARLANVPAIIGAYYATVATFRDVMNKLAGMRCSAREASAFFAGLLVSGQDLTQADIAEGLSTITHNKVKRLVELFAMGAGNKGQDWSDVFQAVTDYYTHESAGKNATKQEQEEASELRTGATMKAKAFAIVQDDKAIAETMALGEKLLANTKKD